MSFLKILKRPAPEPTITGTGPYRLYGNAYPVPAEQRFESLAGAMSAAGSTNPDDWCESLSDTDRIYSRTGPANTGFRQQIIEAPGVCGELTALKDQKRQARELAKHAEQEQTRKELAARTARWAEAEKARKAKDAAEEAAKPKLVISYLTAAGEALGDRNLAVEVFTQPGYTTSTDHTETVAACKACGESHTVEWRQSKWNYSTSSYREEFDKGGEYSTREVRDWAQKHAKTCTAMPKPEVSR